MTSEVTFRLSASTTLTPAGAPPVDTPADLDALEERARTLANQGHTAQAEPLFARALALRERMFGPQAPETLPAVNKLALLYLRMSRAADAETALTRALALAERAGGPLEDEAAMAFGLYGSLMAETGRADEAAPAFRRALEIWTRTPPADVTRLAVVLDAYAKVLLSKVKAEQAEMFERLAIKLFEMAEGETWRTSAAHANLGGILAQLGREAEALPQLEKARAMFIRLGGPEHWCVANVSQTIKAVQAQQALRARPH